MRSRDELMIWRIDRNRYLPFSLPPPAAQGVDKGRFDCPTSSGNYRVLYCGSSAIATFAEVMQQFRLNLGGIRDAAETSPIAVLERGEFRDSLVAPSGFISIDFVENYKICSGVVSLDAPIVSISSSAVIERLRYELLDDLINSGLDDLDLSGITSLRREVTQQISLWAWQQGYSGVSYVSRFGADLTCYALFEDRYELVDTPECIPVGKSDDLLEAADTLRLHFLR